jgi:hypothetical protein
MRFLGRRGAVFKARAAAKGFAGQVFTGRVTSYRAEHSKARDVVIVGEQLPAQKHFAGRGWDRDQTARREMKVCSSRRFAHDTKSDIGMQHAGRRAGTHADFQIRFAARPGTGHNGAFGFPVRNGAIDVARIGGIGIRLEQLPDVAGHVVKPPRIRGETADRFQKLAPLRVSSLVSGIEIRPTGGRLIAPRINRVGLTGTHGVFELTLRGEPADPAIFFRSPSDVGTGVLAVHIHDGKLRHSRRGTAVRPIQRRAMPRRLHEQGVLRIGHRMIEHFEIVHADLRVPDAERASMNQDEITGLERAAETKQSERFHGRTSL